MISSEAVFFRRQGDQGASGRFVRYIQMAGREMAGREMAGIGVLLCHGLKTWFENSHCLVSLRESATVERPCANSFGPLRYYVLCETAI